MTLARTNERAASPQRRTSQGFTLIEMAMVLVIVGLVIMIVFPALYAVRLSTQRSVTEANLQALLRATAVYAQANGCLPCPTPALRSGPGFGVVRGDSPPTPACGDCSRPEGIAPFASLGLPAAMAHDGWGRWITMRIDPTLANPPNLTVPPTAACRCEDFPPAKLPQGCTTAGTVDTGCTALGLSQKGLCSVGPSNTSNMVKVRTIGGNTQYAAAIFVSHGPNGSGAYIAGPIATGNNGNRLPFRATPPCSATGGFESCNAKSSPSLGDIFFNAPPSGNTADPYDDLLLFMDRNNIVSLLGNGSCQTSWGAP